MSARALTTLFIVAAIPAAASAAITDITLHGTGSVTAYQGDPFYGIAGVAPGTAVAVGVTIHLGSAGGDAGHGYAAAPADGFTGTYLLTDNALKHGYASYGWSVTPGDFATSSDGAASFFGDNTLTFVRGVLVRFNLDYEGDPDAHALGQRTWAFNAGPVYSEPPPYGYGRWKITSNSTGTLTGFIPEPSSWALMIAGFGLVGTALRRGRQQRASA